MAKLPKDVAIRVEGVHKEFQLPRHSDDSIKRRIITAFQPKDKGVDVHHVLKGISFDIKKGEFFGIVGRNGSGKSTLLKIISKIYQPTEGRVDSQGKVVAFIELGVGFNGELTGRENVYLNAAMLGFSRAETDAMYDEIVAFSELEQFMDQKLKNYSSGMKVRLAFSVAIRAEADILILDEVLAVGDADFQRKCYNYFKNLKEEHKTIILVSHSMSLIKEYCDQAILIEDGLIAHEGGADEVADEYLNLFAVRKKNNEPHVIDSPSSSFDAVKVVDMARRKNEGAILTPSSILQLQFTVKVNQLIKKSIFAFSVRDKKNNVIIATNTKVLNVPSYPLERGVHEFAFNVQNIFTNGEYAVYATLFDENMDNIYCRTAGLTKFQYEGRHGTVSVALSHPQIELTRGYSNE